MPTSIQPPLRVLPLVSVLLVTLSSSSFAVPVLGFRETFPGTSLSTWTSQDFITNPGTGGTGGAGDGFLEMTTIGPPTIIKKLGVLSFGPEYQGDWQAAGITQVRLSLNDVNNADPLEIHFAIGHGGNFWQYNVGFAPPLHAWGRYIVDLSSSANWTQIISVPGGPFSDALQNVDRILVRHDHAPFMQPPDTLTGDFGLDNIVLTNGTVGVAPEQEGAPLAVELAPPAPNPSRGPVALSLRAFDGSSVRIQIVDVTGRSVRRVELPPASPGPRTWMWDGRDDRGLRVPPGAYRVRASSAAGGTSRALVRVQ